MRRRSPSYSPPRRGYRSPPRGRFGRHRDPPCGLLVRNIPKDSRAEEVRSQFERYGRIRDVYLPKDFHTGEPRGFGFVQYLDPYDAAEAKRHLDRQIFKGREISVVFAEENRKRPDEMRSKERARGRMSYGVHRRSPYHGRSMSRSPRSRSSSPRGGRYLRYHTTSSRRHRRGSFSPSPYRSSRSRSVSPDAYRKGRESSSDDRSRSRSPRNGRKHVNSHRRHRRSTTPGRSTSPPSNGEAQSLSDDRRGSRSRSHSNESVRHAKSSKNSSRSRSKSQKESRSPHSSSPPHRRNSSSSRPGDSRGTPDPAQKLSSMISEPRNGEYQSLEKFQ